MRLAILFLLPAALAAQPASVDGIVLNHTTGQPLSAVHLRLITGDVIGLGGSDLAYGALSDKAGYFSISGIQPGVYTVILERTGFMQAQTGPGPLAPLVLKAGQNLTNYKFEMNPRALLLGRVVDEYGDPVQRVDVDVQPVPPDRGLGFPFLGRPTALTDERGEFRLLTWPGRFYVHASPRPPDNDGPPEIRSDGSIPASYDPTYYPSAPDAGASTIVEVGPGQDVGGIEIRLRRSAPAGPVFTVSGVVTGIPEGARANVALRFGETADWLYELRPGVTELDGKFSFSGLHQASYSAFAQYSSAKTHLRSQSVDFTLDSSDRTDLQLNLKAGEELTGTLEMPRDIPAGWAAEKRTVYLRPILNGNFEGAEIPSAETGKSGAFRLTNIHPDRFRVEVDPLPDNAFIKSIALDGAALDDTTVPGPILDFSRGVSASSLKVTLGLGAQISGKLLGPDGKPSESPLTQIQLWKDDKRVQPAYSDRSVDGAYIFKALLPGKYRIAAFDPLDLGAIDDWDAAMQAFRAAAQEIEVKEGDRIVQNLKLIAKEDLHAK